jgi:hypothetical protein
MDDPDRIDLKYSTIRDQGVLKIGSGESTYDYASMATNALYHQRHHLQGRDTASDRRIVERAVEPRC